MPRAPDGQALRPAADWPRIFVVDGFVDPAPLLPLAQAAHLEPDAAGAHAELPTDAHPALVALWDKVEALAFPSTRRATVRVRRYHEGEGHPLHGDEYRDGDDALVATALVYLTEAEGGETEFPAAPLRIRPTPGRLVLWWTLDADGRPDPRSRHVALPVTAGEKLVLVCFLYAPAPGGRCFFIDDGAPAETAAAIEAACTRQGFRFVPIDARRFDTLPDPLPGPGDALYAAGVSAAAQRVELLLAFPGVATVYDDDPQFTYRNGPLLLERAGVPIPRTVYLPASDPTGLAAQVAWLGGFPVVVKILGGSGGVGVMRVDSLPALASLLDVVRGPILCAYVGDAVHWRVFVVGDVVVGGYRNEPGPDGFRTVPRDGDTEPVPRIVGEVARAATRATRSGLGGVDVLLHASGRPYVLEVNCPCYFGHARADVAEAIVGLLGQKAAAR